MGRTLLTLALAIAAVTLAVGLQDRSRGQVSRFPADAVPAQRYFFTLDGKPAGWALSPDSKTIGRQVLLSRGGRVVSPAVTPSQNKVVFMAGAGMSEGFYDWIRASFDNKPIRKSGEIHACDVNFKSMWIREFTDAHISEVTFPSLDGSSKEPCYMMIKLDPERVTYKKGDGKVVEGQIAPATKKWQCSNFTVEIGELPCTRVAKVDSFTWKQGVIKDEVGKYRDVVRIPVREKMRTGETQNLKLTLPMSDWDAWENWITSSLLSGTELLDGSIKVMSQDRTEGYTLNLHNVSVVRMSVEAQDANQDSVRRFVVELHVNETDFNFVHR